jgi:hypothetical protein
MRASRFIIAAAAAMTLVFRALAPPLESDAIFMDKVQILAGAEAPQDSGSGPAIASFWLANGLEHYGDLARRPALRVKASLVLEIDGASAEALESLIESGALTAHAEPSGALLSGDPAGLDQPAELDQPAWISSGPLEFDGSGRLELGLILPPGARADVAVFAELDLSADGFGAIGLTDGLALDLRIRAEAVAVPYAAAD